MDLAPCSHMSDKPWILITGSDGFIGSALVKYFAADYNILGLDRSPARKSDGYEALQCDLTKAEAIRQALQVARERTEHFAAVIHLAAYFDFTGEEHPLYKKLNVDGTRLLLDALKDFKIDRFIYASTILVHRPGEPGLPITEDSPLEPRWTYPVSKLEAEQVIREHCASPYAILRLAGLYTEYCQSPTLAHQIDRIYQDKITGRVFAGDPNRGQSALHIEDMLSALAATIEHRLDLPRDFTALIGEPLVSTYSALQNAIGEELRHEPVHTISMPKPVAKLGAWAQEKAEALIPDSVDHGEKPFIRPFMIDLSEDHYELDISRAVKHLGWRPKHFLRDELPTLIARFKEDPLHWYQLNKITPPPWLAEMQEEAGRSLQKQVEELEARQAEDHQQWLWVYPVSAVLGLWLMASPPTLGYWGAMGYSDLLTGVVIILFSLLSLSPRLSWLRWFGAAAGLWAAFAPLVFWTTSPAAYLNGTLVGVLVAGLLTVARPTPGIDQSALLHRAAIPPGWSYAPSSWPQRLPIILLAVVGLLISRYLAAYQLEHIPAAWDPFFGDGTERIITSEVSKAWPVPDAGLGGLVYLMEILAGCIGSRYRWHQMPWLTLLFGILIVPLGAVSIYFIIIQPIIIGTWCTLCLIAAAAMLAQIPLSIDEIVATSLLLVERKRRGESLLKILLRGAPMDPEHREQVAPTTAARFQRSADVSAPWTLCLSALIGICLMFSRVLFGNEGNLAHSDHLIGALVVTISISSFAQSGRPLRFVNGVLGCALIAAPFLFSGGSTLAFIADIVFGFLLIAFCIPRGRISSRYGSWDRYLI